eukprot:TRINITY_DN1454_c0_g1_i1.p1 TRINITY_DN1454_c0_g1~~TRINITY_DN1454_c0_g1_i1.p1  ORF type:complete len:881 (-),score=191.96 TRINITY_DN1454_c0_g1_i1:214-2856(-)
MMPGVYRVDLFTRQISSADVDWSYGEPTEMLSSGSYDVDGQGGGESSGAYIVRIPCGPRDQYLRKELLWPYIQEFVDGALAHILNMSRVLGDQVGKGEPVWPYVIHGHYADAGDSAALLSGALNVPMVLTGHSLGRNKLEQLLKQGRMSKADINATYKIMRRIEAEELSLDAAELVITSTKQEIEEQWGLYDGFDVKLEKVLRARARRKVSSHGRYMPRMVVIPPGMDFSNVVPEQDTADGDGDLAALINGDGSLSPRALPPIWTEVMRFFSNPHKPMILALSRPDPKKNLTTLVKAFGECRPLRELANLTLVMGNRDDIDEMTGGNAAVLTTVLKLIDKYDLYGQVAYPKHHKQSDVPEIYRLAAKTKGVFINPALVEPFGLTLIEAAAHGLPMVATKNGGPVDIHRALNNGLLVDPHDQKAIADALLKLVADRNLWNDCRRNGLKNIHLFSWPEHCRTYLSRVAVCRMRHPQWQTDTLVDANLQDEYMGDSLKDVQDMSLRLSVDGEKSSINGSVDNSAELDKLLAGKADPEVHNQVKRVLDKLKKPSSFSPMEESEIVKLNVDETRMLTSTVIASKQYPALRKKKKLFVIAVDCYDGSGEISPCLIDIVRDIFKAVRSDTLAAKFAGFVLSTALTVDETLQILDSASIQTQEFDALICSSGSELYYPTPSAYPDDGLDKKLCPDPDYRSHIDYRWGGDGLRKTLSKIMVPEGIVQDSEGEAIFEDTEHRNAHCFSYFIKDSTKVPKVDDFRQKLRMRGLRCHLMYCRNSTKLHVIPLLASRSQALRYLFVRWGLDVSNMYVFVGETGDTDYEGMLAGAHKTIMMKGVVENGSERLLRSTGSYQRDDIVPSENPNLVTIESPYNSEKILNALQKLRYK